AQGRFRLKLVTPPGPAVLSILPDKYATVNHQLDDQKRGDLGTFTLQPGISLTGKMLDVKGKPLAGINVNAMPIQPKQLKGEYPLGGAGNGRSAVTNAKGEFTMEALAPGTYTVEPATLPLGALSIEEGEVKFYPVPDLFIRQGVTLKE